MTKKQIEALIKEKQGIRLDIGGGANPNKGFVNIDILPLPEVDIVWDLERTPWPLPDECVLTATASHILEHISPHTGDKRLQGLVDLLIAKGIFTEEEGDEYMGLPGPAFINVMNELWRVMKPRGQFAFVSPHAESPGMMQDPTHCLLDGAEVLTESGFKKMQDVGAQENILTLNLETEETEFVPCVGKVYKEYSGDILRFQNRAIDIAVTPNHDLIFRTIGRKSTGYRKKAADTFENKTPQFRKGLKTITDWGGVDGDKDDYFMELLGWYISEGCCTKSGSRRIRICQGSISNQDKYLRIQQLLDNLNLKYKAYELYFSIDSDELFDELSVLGKSLTKYIPQTYKNYPKDKLECLLEGLMLGDGESHVHGGGRTYTTISKQLADDVSEIAVKCGYNAVIRKRPGKEFVAPNGKTYTRKDQYRISVTNNNAMLYPKPVRENYDGKIVCVQVEKNNTILTRYNGHIAWVGNCNFINETTLHYFDPDPEGHNIGQQLYGFYRPKPWKIVHQYFKPDGNLEVLLEKRLDDVSFHAGYVSPLTSITEEKR